jgi:hypothetical protein
MKKIYPLLLVLVAISGCSKDLLKRYENRVQGVWRLTDVDRRGIGGSLSHLTFTEGEFTFTDGGQFSYVNGSGATYKGSWYIRREWRSGNCSTNDNGSTNCNDRQVNTLHITAVDFISQDVKTEYFDDMLFTGTNRFNAFIHSGLHTYIFHFRR